METYGGAVPRFPGAETFLRQTSPAFQAVVWQGWKLIRPKDRDGVLYHLLEDPGELRNVRHENPEKFKELDGLLDQWNNAHPRGAENASEMTDEDLEALKALGYVE